MYRRNRGLKAAPLPMPACQAELSARMLGDEKHRVYPFALGRTLGELKLQLHAHAASSSLLVEADEFRKLNQGDSIFINKRFLSRIGW